MNTQELQMVIDMMNSLGDKSLVAFIFWLCLEHLIPPMVWFVTMYFGFKHVGTPLINTLILTQYFKEIRDKFDLGAAGYLSASEIDRIKVYINEALR